jgi:hypothetical protein
MRGTGGCFFSGLHGSGLSSCETSRGKIAPFDSLDQDSLTMISRFMVAALCFLGPLACVAHSANINGEASYISFSVPGALGTYPTSINGSMEVTGYYNVSSMVARGFLREADGTITTFDVGGGIWTQPEGINAVGNITGFYYEKSGAAVQGFLRYADGRIITFAGNPAIYLGLLPVSINDFDEIAGNYVYRIQSAFTRSGAGVFTAIPAPPEESIEVTAINGSGSVVGYDGGINDLYTGFVAHPDGYWAEFAVPANPDCANQTIPDAINAAGTIAGWYTSNEYNDPACKSENTGGFVRSPDGELTLFQPPGTMAEFLEHLPEPGYTPWPHWISIDQAGDITGFYRDAAGVQHGFVRNPYGTITSFDPPEGNETNPTSINDGGAIAGYYQYHAGGGPPVGFIRVP